MSARLLLFDLYSGGHHRSYLEMLARAWVTGPDRGLMEIAAPEELFETHEDFRRWIEVQDRARLAAVPVSLDAPLREGDLGLTDVLRNDLLHGRVLRSLTRERRPAHVLAMFVDHLQASLALRRTGPCPVSGIYFRPSFHYPGEPRSTRIRKRLLLRAAMSNPRLHRLLSLDPYAAETLGDPRVVWLPDGVDTSAFGESPTQIRARWGVEPDRRVLLFFGVVSARKGIHEVLAALPLVQAPVTLVIAGRVPREERLPIEEAVARARTESPVPIVQDDRYVRDEEIQDLFGASDAALVAYRRHVGSSNVLIRAAAAGVPVVGPSYGLMARHIGVHHLGLSVDPSSAPALASAVDRVLSGDSGFDAGAAQAFSEANSVRAFTDRVFREVLV